MATSPIYGLPLPDTTSTDQVPADLLTYVTAAEKFFVGQFANASARDTKIPSPVGGMVAWLTSPGKFVYYDGGLAAWVDLFNPQAWATFTPTLRTLGGTAIPLGTGATQIGRFQVYGKTCNFQVSWVFGSGLTGISSGQLTFDLPVTPSVIVGLAQNGPCSLWVPSLGLSFAGLWVINDGTGKAKPQYPIDTTHSTMGFFQDKDGTGVAGTGIPAISGQEPIQNTGSMVASGSYQIS